MMNDDMELVRDFARNRSEEAFAALVSRNLNLVYSVALRQVRDPHLAEEITQTVFTVLARKAGSLGPNTVLSGWLCRTARYVAARTLTQQHRRQHREQEAYMQSQLNEVETTAWTQIEPLLETAMAQLGEKDHDALVLRFFEGRDFKTVGAALTTTEAGAKMRVNRALEKLRKFFAQRGVTLSAATIALTVSAHSVQAAPIGLATSVTVAAVQGTVVTVSTLTLIKNTLTFMAWSKLKTAAVVGTLTFLVVGTTTFVLPAFRSPPLAFAGYVTPEASVQSSIWAGSTGDFKQFEKGCTPELQERFQGKWAGKSDEEIKQETLTWAKSLKGWKITKKEVISEQEVRLHITAPASPTGLRDGKVIVVMAKIGNEWKQAGEH